jgi:hypothetical protein
MVKKHDATQALCSMHTPNYVRYQYVLVDLLKDEELLVCAYSEFTGSKNKHYVM